jgi:hypothetical protein
MDQQGQKEISRQGTVAPRQWKRVWIPVLVAVLQPAFSLQAPVRAQEAASSGDRAGATQLLQHFLEPDADYRALTLKLRPRTEDYDAVYRQPLAGLLEKTHKPMWQDEGSAIMPKPGQTEILLGLTTTDNLIAKDSQLGEFPGGYEDVLSYMKPGNPIARFKFVAPGETLGMSFDGLVYVNGHWVLIPKPWRALP